MIYIKSLKEIEKIERSNIIIAEALQFIEKILEPGIDTQTIDKEIENYIISKKAKPAFKGLYGFPAATCISINEEVVHGIPGKRKLQDGDIVGIDIGVNLDGYFGDAAKTFLIGNVSEDKKMLCKITEESLYLGIEQCTAGNRIGDIGWAIQSHVEKHGFSVVRDLVGHGVGIKPHEEPQVPNYGTKGKGMRLKVGMVIAIEPMINMGVYQVLTAEDGWTIYTRDRKPSAHYEHSIAILRSGPRILSKLK